MPGCFHETLGKVLAELHGIPKDKVVEAGLVVHTPEDVRQSMKERMDTVKAKFGVGESLWNRWQTWLNDDEMWPREVGFIHGDIHAGHTLIDKDGNVIGLIDWTGAKLADVSNDFVFHYKAFGEKGLESIIKAYKATGGYYWPKMKEHKFQYQDVGTYALFILSFFKAESL